ncbi:hypothetical protein AeMF1_012701 [Aphanomyces euteiches]|nr:hypothetical protein AeMF1_012701 [Aphanomyces euteiches]
MKRIDSDNFRRDSSIGETAMLPMSDDVPMSPKRSTKRTLLIGLGVLVVAGGVAAAVVLSTGKSKSNTASDASSNANASTPSPTNDYSSVTTAPPPPTSAGATTAPPPVKSDPETDSVVLTMLAIGDWGSTTGRGDDGTNPGSCCVLYKSGPNKNQVNTNLPRYKVDYRAQESVGKLLGMSAAQLKPARVLSHGDNIYWNGVGEKDILYRMQETFEKMYSAPALQGVPWLNVAGNHDIGGSAYICGDSDSTFRKCTSTAEMLTYLEKKFTLQAQYVSPNGNRWIMKDHYYVERVTQGGVTVDIYNLDTNEATTHGAQQVCCQCFGAGGSASQCDNIMPGDPLCAGGDMGMFNACMEKIQSWADQSYKGALKDLEASKADFKIINTHYSPQYHMNAPRIEKWFNLTKNMGVHAWFNGHTHGFNHDLTDWNTHFFQNGAGGGIVSQSSGSVVGVDGIKPVWVAAGQPYGFMELSFTKEWMKVQFVSFDKSWQFNGFTSGDISPGGIARGHCWFIHKSRDGPGVECKSSVNGVVGLPTR